MACKWQKAHCNLSYFGHNTRLISGQNDEKKKLKKVPLKKKYLHVEFIFMLFINGRIPDSVETCYAIKQITSMTASKLNNSMMEQNSSGNVDCPQMAFYEL
jgi:hypothetical protein